MEFIPDFSIFKFRLAQIYRNKADKFICIFKFNFKSKMGLVLLGVLRYSTFNNFSGFVYVFRNSERVVLINFRH
jgi:hypothetical protein